MRIARLEVEKEYVDKEYEIRKIQLSKEIAMANAEEVAMKKIVEEEEQSAIKHKKSVDGFPTQPDTILPFNSILKTKGVINNETDVEGTIKTFPIAPIKSDEEHLKPDEEHPNPLPKTDESTARTSKFTRGKRTNKNSKSNYWNPMPNKSST